MPKDPAPDPRSHQRGAQVDRFERFAKYPQLFCTGFAENGLVGLRRHQEHDDVVSFSLPDALGEADAVVRIGQPVIEQSPPSSRTVTPAEQRQRLVAIAARQHHGIP